MGGKDLFPPACLGEGKPYLVVLGFLPSGPRPAELGYPRLLVCVLHVGDLTVLHTRAQASPWPPSTCWPSLNPDSVRLGAFSSDLCTLHCPPGSCARGQSLPFSAFYHAGSESSLNPARSIVSSPW